MKIQILPEMFTVCRLSDCTNVDLSVPYTFVACTDEENSLVCPSERVPGNILVREDGWRCLRIAGTLDFSLVGILARIAQNLAEAGIPIFAVSTYNTDYILLKAEKLQDAVKALSAAGYGTEY